MAEVPSRPNITPVTLPAEPPEADNKYIGESSTDGQDNDYQLLESAGRGGMGEVYRARDRLLERDVAIKFLQHATAAGYKRFRVEALAAARLQHPNIAGVYRFGQWLSGDREGQPYLVCEYIHGQNLTEVKKPMPWQSVLQLAIGLSSGLAAAHHQDVLHRDIKLANIMLAADGQPKIIDFGIAKMANVPELYVRDVATGELGREASHAALTTDGRILGTPHYIAPEVLQGLQATEQSDIYSLGVVLYELCSGRTPFHDVEFAHLKTMVTEHESPALKQVAPDVHSHLCSIVNQCLARVPTERYPSADHLRDELERLWEAGRERSIASISPYPGLQPFDGDRRDFFFGRDDDIQRVIAKMRSRQFVLVLGASGVGKTSLLRAGVLPQLVDDRLDDTPCRIRTMIPGNRPLGPLAVELSRLFGMDALDMDQLLDGLLDDRNEQLRRMRARAVRVSPVLYIDQFEELFTLASIDDARTAGYILSGLAERVPSMRFVATMRSDKLAALAERPGFEPWLVPESQYLLRALDADGVRAAIQRPAWAKKARFESQKVVETLASVMGSARGGLPLLQFALARIWRERNQASARIPDSALDTIGGVAGALSRHADGVLARMSSEAYTATRRMLLQLVTAHRTRARYSASELIPVDSSRAQTYRDALASLVNERLVVESPGDDGASYELAHEILITGWTTLRHWLDREGEIRAVKERLAEAAAEWERMGRGRDGLWRGKSLAEAEHVEFEDLPGREREFLMQSRNAARRRRWLLGFAALLPILLIVGTYIAIKAREQRSIAARVARELREARPYVAEAREHARAFVDARTRAFALFNDGYMAKGQEVWSSEVLREQKAAQAFVQAGTRYLRAWSLDAENGEIRREWAQMTHEHARLAYFAGRATEYEKLLEQLAGLDVSGKLLERWRESVRVLMTNDPLPAGVRACPYRKGEDGRITLTQTDCERPNIAGEWSLTPDSYLIVIPASPATREVRYPILVEPRAVADLDFFSVPRLDIPSVDSIPDNFIPVPAGKFLFGAGQNAEEEVFRIWYKTLPLHPRTTGSYLIARDETTWAEWIRFLRAEPSQTTELLPNSQEEGRRLAVKLSRDTEGRFSLQFGPKDSVITALEGEPFEYPGRTYHQRMAWESFPVLGASPEMIEAYLDWLRRTGEVPGARLCREDEWERAARGADGRNYPHGETLRKEDANYDDTHRNDSALLGPDSVGIHEGASSPFGVRDMVGNAVEITLALPGTAAANNTRDGEFPTVMRGGAYFFSDRGNNVRNREPLSWQAKPAYAGFRVCADWRP